jgi:hypothetical protein
VENGTDPTEDIDELWAIRRSNEVELELINSWLLELDHEEEKLKILQRLLELRSLCLLRNTLLTNVEEEHIVAAGAI